jgi:multiple sugar transport system substrate-binding protein
MGENTDMKRYPWVWFFLILISAVSACAEVAPPVEPVMISFAYDDLEAGPYEALVTKFSEIYPHITIERSADYDEADVFLVSPFNLDDLLEENAILNLASLVQDDESFDLADYYPGAVGSFISDDKVWAIPDGVTVMVLYYNQDLFDRYGVPYPQPGWTWNDFLDAARAIREPTDGVFGYGDVDEYFHPFMFVYLRGGRITDSMYNPTRMTYDEPQTIAAMEWYAALAHDYNVAPRNDQFFELGGNVQTGVYAERIGMWIDWIHVRGGSTHIDHDWPALWEMRWGMVPLPQYEDAFVPMITDGYAIASDTAHPDECWQWISFLSAQAQLPSNMFPARKSLAESDEYKALVGSDLVDVAQVALQDSQSLSPALFEFIDFDIYGRAINSIHSGVSTPEEALIRAQQQSEGGD